VSALRLEDNELLVVVTCHKPQSAILDYAKRWGIETLFGCLKTRGFCLESTHLQDAERLRRMVALLTIALCWAFKTGECYLSTTLSKSKSMDAKPKAYSGLA
jgi:hypothetical protein